MHEALIAGGAADKPDSLHRTKEIEKVEVTLHLPQRLIDAIQEADPDKTVEELIVDAINNFRRKVFNDTSDDVERKRIVDTTGVLIRRERDLEQGRGGLGRFSPITIEFDKHAFRGDQQFAQKMGVSDYWFIRETARIAYAPTFYEQS